VTDRLYYRDSSVLSFEGTIVECGEHEGGWYTILDRSAFYPTSGGQQHDLGRLSGIDIVDVVEGENAAVRHISNEPVGNVGDSVSGTIDRERRRRHQQQHTAQHILSQASVRLCGFDTLSVHLGEDYGAIEFATAEITAEQLELVESFGNDVITRNLPVTISFLEDADLADTKLRRPTARTGKIRVVSVGDIDVSACGGTHCSATGEVALLKITGVEKIRGHAVVRFLSGDQAIADYRSRFAATSRLTRLLTCHVDDLPVKIERLLADIKALRNQVGDLSRELLPTWAGEIAGRAFREGSHTIVAEVLDLPDSRQAVKLAGVVADRVQGIVLFIHEGRLLLTTPEAGDFDAGLLARRLGERLGLKGGGSKRQAQLGGAANDKLPEYVKLVARLLDEM